MQIVPFNFDGGEVRVITRDGEPWFVLTDVCRVLEHSNPSMAGQALDDDERSKLSLGRQGEATIISEAGLYRLVMRSDKPQAKPFQKWVTAEVLPSVFLSRFGYGTQFLHPDTTVGGKIEPPQLVTASILGDIAREL